MITAIVLCAVGFKATTATHKQVRKVKLPRRSRARVAPRQLYYVEWTLR